MKKEEINLIISSTEFRSILKFNNQDVEIDFSKVVPINHNLADDLLEHPLKVIPLISSYLTELMSSNINVRIINLPKTEYVPIRHIRANNLSNLIAVEGIIRQASDVRPLLTTTTTECPGCGAVTKVRAESGEKKKCICGMRGPFPVISQEFIDQQRIVIEETQESLETTGTQPKRLNILLEGTLVDPKLEKKAIPGKKVVITGVLKEIDMELKGMLKNRREIVLIANSLVTTEREIDEIDISKEEIQQFQEMSVVPGLLDKLAESLAPSVFGHEQIKRAIILQLFGGVRKQKSDNSFFRGDIHFLLCGEPGCIDGDSYVTLADGTFKKISSLGKEKGDKLNINVQIDRRSKLDNPYALTDEFFKYVNTATKKITLETGKELIGTYNHPVYVKSKLNGKTIYDWKRLDQLQIGDKVKVMTKIPSYKKTYIEMKQPISTFQKLIYPKYLNEDIAQTYGLLVGDGYSNKYKIGFTFEEKEIENIAFIKNTFKTYFNKDLMLSTRKSNGFGYKDSNIKVIDLTINSKAIASMFQMNRSVNKRVPEEIMASKNSVIASFIKGLFEADGCCLYDHSTRNRTYICLKSNSHKLLLDIQLLLLRFGIQCRIHINNLFIRRSSDVLKYGQYIGFISNRKQVKLDECCRLASIKTKNRGKAKRYEEVSVIKEGPIQTVYDIHVPNEHRFISNGIISHNTAKSVLIRNAVELLPRARFVSGKSATGAGLTGAAIKDEVTGQWTIEAGAMPLANNSLLVTDEFEKMNPTDRENMHEALEQQTISFAKAGIQCTLNTRTSLLAAANPKYGRFQSDNLLGDINLPPSLLSRFDGIFIIRDSINTQKDEMIADKILSEHSDETKEGLLTHDFMKKYISYARRLSPKLSKESDAMIKKFYVTMRNMGKTKNIIQIGARQLEGIIRLTLAHAKMRLSEVSNPEDTEKAIEIMTESLRQVGYNAEDGLIDSYASISVPQSKAKKILYIKDIIYSQANIGKSMMTVKDIHEKLESKIPETEIWECLKALCANGDLFEPKRGYFSAIR